MKLWTVLLLLIGYVESIHIPESHLILNNSKPLSIQCFTNKTLANIEFRSEFDLIATCNRSVQLICVVNDWRFQVFVNSLNIPNYYQLQSVNNFDQTLCGTYTCIDLDTRLQDSVNVSFKDFDNETFNIHEGDEVVFITTSCSFAATLSEMQSSWFIGDSNTQINLRNVGFNKTDNCINATCDGSSAQRFTVGLNFTNQDELFASSSVRVEIVHPLFPLRPLSWRSSKKYPVKEANGEDDKHPSRISTGTIVGITLSLVAFCAISILTFVLRRRTKRKKSLSLISEPTTADRQLESYQNKDSATPDTPSKQSDINKPSVTAEQDLAKSVQEPSNILKGLQKTDTKAENINQKNDSKKYKSGEEKWPMNKELPNIPPDLNGYAKYSTVQNGKYVLIWNFKREDVDIVKQLQYENISDLFSFNEQSNLASFRHEYMACDIGETTCKSVIEKELNTDDKTDCFICIISSIAKPNSNFITDGKKEESIGHLASLDNNIISKNLVGKPKVLIFDL